jgi:hypothetical protein
MATTTTATHPKAHSNDRDNRVHWRMNEDRQAPTVLHVPEAQIPSRPEPNTEGLAFDFLADGAAPVLTGHENGVITSSGAGPVWECNVLPPQPKRAARVPLAREAQPRYRQMVPDEAENISVPSAHSGM